MKYLVCVFCFFAVLEGTVSAEQIRQFYPLSDWDGAQVTIKMENGYDVDELPDMGVSLDALNVGKYKSTYRAITPLASHTNHYEKFIPKAIELIEYEKEKTKRFVDSCVKHYKLNNKNTKPCIIEEVRHLGEVPSVYSDVVIDKAKERLKANPQDLISIKEFDVSPHLKVILTVIDLEFLGRRSGPRKHGMELFYKNELIEELDGEHIKIVFYKNISGEVFMHKVRYRCGKIIHISKVTKDGLVKTGTVTIDIPDKCP